MPSRTIQALALGVGLITLFPIGCGINDQGETPETSAPAGSERPATSTGPVGSESGNSVDVPTKPGTGVNATLMLSASFAKVGLPVAFGAQFVTQTPGDSINLTKKTIGVAKLDLTLPSESATDGEPTVVNGTVAASGNGSGMAQVGLKIRRDGRPQETRLTIFVEADLGYAAFGEASESDTRRTLADGLLHAGVIDEAAHAQRMAEISGGSG
jgi:hypothetical protein